MVLGLYRHRRILSEAKRGVASPVVHLSFGSYLRLPKVIFFKNRLSKVFIMSAKVSSNYGIYFMFSDDLRAAV